MTIPDVVVKNVIRKVLEAKDYRGEIVAIIDARFLESVTEFFKKIVDAKLANRCVTVDWYKKELLNSNLNSSEILINAGLNRKTVSNMYNSARREIVIKASREHYETLLTVIEDLTEQSDVDVTLTIKFGSVSVDLNINESLVVINSLAVQRAAVRGSAWSAVGKRVEKPLMETLCKLFRVPSKFYSKWSIPGSTREVDFYLLNQEQSSLRCEVKLMGKGNPESADAVVARESRVFVADKLSKLNKKQLDERGIQWVEMRSPKGFIRFEKVLASFSIPFQPFEGDLQNELDKILPVVFASEV